MKKDSRLTGPLKARLRYMESLPGVTKVTMMGFDKQAPGKGGFYIDDKVQVSRGSNSIPVHICDSRARGMLRAMVHTEAQSYDYVFSQLATGAQNGEKYFVSGNPLAKIHVEALKSLDEVARVQVHPVQFLGRTYHGGVHNVIRDRDQFRCMVVGDPGTIGWPVSVTPFNRMADDLSFMLENYTQYFREYREKV